MVGRVWPRHGHRGRPLNSVVRRRMSKYFPAVVTWAIAASLFAPSVRADYESFDQYVSVTKSLGGAAARDCGVVRLRASGAEAVSCVKAALSGAGPFVVIFQRQGFDSEIFLGVVRTGDGELWSVNWDSDVTGGSGKKSRITKRPCPRIVIDEFVTCAAD
jgi:hypothetical protein